MKNFISVFGSYKVDYHCFFSYLDETGDFCYDNIDKVYSCDGVHLMETIIRLLSDNLLISFAYNNDILFVDHFNPDNGTGAVYNITIKEVVKNN